MSMLEIFPPVCLNSFHKSNIFVVKSHRSILLSFLPVTVSLGIPSISSICICVHVRLTHCYKFKNYRNTQVNSASQRKPLNGLGSIFPEFMLLVHTHTHFYSLLGPTCTPKSLAQLGFPLVSAAYLGTPPLIRFFSKG